MIKEKRIFTKEDFAGLSDAEKVHYTFVDTNNNITKFLTKESYPRIKARGASQGLTQPKTAKEIALQPLQDCVDKNKPKTEFSNAELVARAKYSEQFCRNLIHKSVDSREISMAKIQEQSPEDYRTLKIAMVSYGLLGKESLAWPAPKPKPVETPAESSVILNADQARLFGLPEGHRMSTAQFIEVSNAVNGTPAPNSDPFATENMMPSLKKNDD